MLDAYMIVELNKKKQKEEQLRLYLPIPEYEPIKREEKPKASTVIHIQI